jgi:hypothetical protein
VTQDVLPEGASGVTGQAVSTVISSGDTGTIRGVTDGAILFPQEAGSCSGAGFGESAECPEAGWTGEPGEAEEILVEIAWRIIGPGNGDTVVDRSPSRGHSGAIRHPQAGVPGDPGRVTDNESEDSTWSVSL